MNSESPGLVASSLTIVDISNPKLEQRYWNYVSILYSNDVVKYIDHISNLVIILLLYIFKEEITRAIYSDRLLSDYNKLFLIERTW
jgi:hypothetical protein